MTLVLDRHGVVHLPQPDILHRQHHRAALAVALERHDHPVGGRAFAPRHDRALEQLGRAWLQPRDDVRGGEGGQGIPPGRRLLGRAVDPPGGRLRTRKIRAAIHSRWPLRFTCSQCKDNITLYHVYYTSCRSQASALRCSPGRQNVSGSGTGRYFSHSRSPARRRVASRHTRGTATGTRPSFPSAPRATTLRNPGGGVR